MSIEQDVEINVGHEEPTEEEECNQASVSTACLYSDPDWREWFPTDLSQLNPDASKHDDHPEYKLETGWFDIAPEISPVVSERDGIEFDAGK